MWQVGARIVLSRRKFAWLLMGKLRATSQTDLLFMDPIAITGRLVLELIWRDVSLPLVLQAIRYRWWCIS